MNSFSWFLAGLGLGLVIGAGGVMYLIKKGILKLGV